MGGSALDDLIEILKIYQKDDELLQELIQRLEDILDHQRKIQQKRYDAENKEAAADMEREREARARVRAQEKQERETDLSKRKTYDIQLLPLRKNIFSLQLPDYEDMKPSRVDWLHWLQKLDPDHAKPTDIELREDGAIVEIHNELALKTIFTSCQRGPRFYVTLPNRRMYADLNDCKDTPAVSF